VKVKVEVTVDINPEAWEMNYGISGAKEIREDVKEFAKNAILAQFDAVGLLA
jgi:hypothetical protein